MKAVSIPKMMGAITQQGTQGAFSHATSLEDWACHRSGGRRNESKPFVSEGMARALFQRLANASWGLIIANYCELRPHQQRVLLGRKRRETPQTAAGVACSRHPILGDVLFVATALNSSESILGNVLSVMWATVAGDNNARDRATACVESQADGGACAHEETQV